MIDTIGDLLRLSALLRDGIPLNLDYSQSILALIMAGRYHSADAEIGSFNPLDNHHESTIRVGKLFDYSLFDLSDDGSIVLRDKAFRLGSLFHLLTLGAQYPDFQKFFSIIGPDSGLKQYNILMMPYLGIENGMRVLRLVSRGDKEVIKKMCVLGIEK